MTKSNVAKSGKTKPSRSKAVRGSARKFNSRQHSKQQRRSTRSTTKLAAIIDLLRQTEGASIEQLSKATGWQAHSVRGVISGTIKKKLGFTVTSTKAGGVRVYRISA